jgi:hypothetical protein
MTDDQFERLISGISLLAAETYISNVFAKLAAIGVEPEKPYDTIRTAYALAERFQDKIYDWDKDQGDPDFDDWFDKTFPR